MADQVDSTSTESAVPDSSLQAPHAGDSASSKSASAGNPSLLRRFLEMIRFSHTVFALPFAGMACILAMALPVEGGASIHEQLGATTLALRLFAVLLCMVAARSAAMAFNRLVDAKIDAANPRTQSRHIPAGTLTLKQVWSFFAVCCLAFFGACLLFLPNWLPAAGAVPVLLWICGYSFAKRFTSGAHLWLGIALALSPICAWVAIRGETVVAVPADVLPSVMLAFAIAFWVAGFDMIYACQDADFDRGAGLMSVPARFGIGGALRIAAVLHAIMLVVLLALPVCFPGLSFGWLYYVAWLIVAGLVIRQHAIVSPSNLSRVGVAFFNINALISLGFCTVASLDAWLR